MQPKRLPGLMAPYADPHAANAPQPGNPHHANGPSAPGAPMSPVDLGWLQAVNAVAPWLAAAGGGFAGTVGSGGNFLGSAAGTTAGLGIGQAAMHAFDIPRRIEQQRANPLDNPDPMLMYRGQPFQ